MPRLMREGAHMTSLHEYFLTTRGMKAVRAELCSKYEWFLHASAADAFDSIKNSGLKLYHPGTDFSVDASAVKKHFGNEKIPVVALHPQGSCDALPNRGGMYFLMAVHRDNLPTTIGLDWSFGYYWGQPDEIKRREPKKTNKQIFCQVVQDSGVVVCYEPIPSAALRVWCKETLRENPASWPLISDVGTGEIETFRRGIITD